MHSRLEAHPLSYGAYRRFVCLICRVQQGHREKYRVIATISLRRIVAIEFSI